MVYQPVYPRTDKIRWSFVAKRCGEVVCLSVFIWFTSAQYATPVLRNSLDKIASLDIPSIIERLLKLSTISLIIWLAGFFALFQSFLNALAEVTRFADRSFYDEWWNSESLGVYWRTWNKPVYQYFKRHVYSPMRSRGWSNGAAGLAVFFLSAVLHELLVGVPTHNLIGMFFYHPNTRSLKRSHVNAKNRRRLPRHVPPTTSHPDHQAAGEEEVSQRQAAGQHHLLGLVHHLRSAVCRPHVLLRVAGQVWQRQQDDYCAAAGSAGAGDLPSSCLE